MQQATKRILTATFAAISLALSGCSPRLEHPNFFTMPPLTSVTVRMNFIAVQSNEDQDRGGQAPQVRVRDCYVYAMQRTSAFDVRDCMILDYTAYNLDRVVSAERRVPGAPFFSDDAEKDRMAAYMSYAGFDSVPRMLRYLKDAHLLVQKYMIRDLREKARTCGNTLGQDVEHTCM